MFARSKQVLRSEVKHYLPIIIVISNVNPRHSFVGVRMLFHNM